MLYDGNAPTHGKSAATAVYYSGTYGDGANPCSLIVSSASGGFFAVVNANGAVIFQRPTPPPTTVPPPTTMAPPTSTPASTATNTGTLMAGQSLAQVGPRSTPEDCTAVRCTDD